MCKTGIPGLKRVCIRLCYGGGTRVSMAALTGRCCELCGLMIGSCGVLWEAVNSL